MVHAGPGSAPSVQDRARRLLGNLPLPTVAIALLRCLPAAFCAIWPCSFALAYMRAIRRQCCPRSAAPAPLLLSLLLVAFANVGTQGTGSYVNCMIVKSGMPKVSYKVLVLIAMVYVSALTVWGGVEEHFGTFISIAAFIQAPIIGMIVVDYLARQEEKNLAESGLLHRRTRRLSVHKRLQPRRHLPASVIACVVSRSSSCTTR